MNLMVFEKYTCQIKAVEVKPTQPDIPQQWVFVTQYIDLSDEETKDPFIIEIPSIQTYDTFEDAIQDAYGIIEYYGWRFSPEHPVGKIPVIRWNVEKDSYVTDFVYYDGFDFYPYDEEDDKEQD